MLLTLYIENVSSLPTLFTRNDFIDQLNRSGGGGLTLSLRDSKLTDFYHYVCKGFNFEDESNRKVGASFAGLQRDDTWILSSYIQIDADGNLIRNQYKSKYVWLPHIAAQNAGVSDVNFGSLSPDVHLPLTTAPLKPMLECMQLCFKHYFISLLLACSSILMGLHYDKVRAHYEGCPVPFFYGDRQEKLVRPKLLLQSWECTSVDSTRTPVRNGFKIDAACLQCHSL